MSTETAVEKIDTYHVADLRNLDNFDTAMQMAQQAFGSLEVADEVIGDGFALLKEDDKARLVGVPLLFMEWRFSMGTYGEFVSARVVAQTDNKGGVARYILNDGSTGICKQLRDFTDEHHRAGGLVARHGLRISNYKWKDESDGGKEKDATTYYIDTTA